MATSHTTSCVQNCAILCTGQFLSLIEAYRPSIDPQYKNGFNIRASTTLSTVIVKAF